MDKTDTQKSKRVFVAMSGGVDSSVAALLMKREGYDVTGVFMRCYNIDGCAERDAEDARRVAGRLSIPLYVWDFEKEYKRRVVEYMVKGYAHGITPNPDVMCNKEIKFGLFLARALAHGADYVATGHYVRIANSKERIAKSDAPLATRYLLFAARDENKDQSYFLWTLTQEQLRHCLFPIGDYLKPEVRTIARRAKLSTAEKKDSQGICFLGKFSLKDFLKERIRSRKGKVVTVSGMPVGEHDGAAFYTIGQRHGLALGIKNRESRMKGGATTLPFYVAGKDMKKNTLTVAEGPDNLALYKKEVLLTDMNFLVPLLKLKARSLKFPVYARVRYRQPLARAYLRVSANNEYFANKRMRKVPFANSKQIHYSLMFVAPQKFVAEGQSAVFYSRRGELLGGGVIM
ncbi:MAG: tRNA 2-thiouridine(34) synthase MnmA [Candidatus Liptonbacteria bacterium]|nr:tRNA 2-thiouridine(34) synthase MnmA [Candidatus Liptonbacteria bacterium]